MRRWWFNSMGAALAVCTLSSCATLEKGRIQFKPDTSGAISFLVRASTEGLPGDRIPDDLIGEVTRCGFDGNQMARGDNVLVDAYLSFANATALNRSLDCLPLDWSKREISLVEKTGLLYKTYTATIWLEQPAIAAADSSVMSDYFDRARQASRPNRNHGSPEPNNNEPVTWVKNDLPLMPMSLSVDMPGGDLEITREVRMAGFENTGATTGNRAEITLRMIAGQSDARDAILEPIVSALDRGEHPQIPNDVYKVTITSSEARFELSTIGTIVSVLGALFGSGVLVQLVKWLRGRKAGPAT